MRQTSFHQQARHPDDDGIRRSTSQTGLFHFSLTLYYYYCQLPLAYNFVRLHRNESWFIWLPSRIGKNTRLSSTRDKQFNCNILICRNVILFKGHERNLSKRMTK